MSDGAFPDRLTQLRARWDSDPSSRIFLQLAEEYRHQGRVREALEVLEGGLKEHPGYLSALVAKGRCLLELGEPDRARTVLERVVKQDATQMVANKLLVRAYIETSDPERARERLDLYTLLNDSDPEIEELRRRLRAMDQPSQAENPPPPALPGRPPLSQPAPSRTAGEDIFDLGLPATRPVVPAVREEEPFAELWAPALKATPPEIPEPPPSPAALAPEPAAAPSSVATSVDIEEPEPEHVLFPGMASQDSRQRYLAGLASEGLFHLDPTPEVLEPVEPEPVEARRVEEELPRAAVAPPEPLAAPVEPEPELVVAPEPEPAPEPIATATLGELYLRQGYPAEAERIFREVLRREPESAVALEGIAKLSQPVPAETGTFPEVHPVEARDLLADDLLAGYQPAGRTGPAEGRSRKAFLLSRYLERIRRGGRRDVS